VRDQAGAAGYLTKQSPRPSSSQPSARRARREVHQLDPGDQAAEVIAGGNRPALEKLSDREHEVLA
jgi:hypothetical protein